MTSGGIAFRGREPVLKVWHVEGRDGENVDEPLVAPGAQTVMEVLEFGWVVEFHDGVCDL